MSDRRQRRDRRRSGAAVQLTPRDGALLRAVARFRAAPSRDLSRLFFSGVSRERGAQRLRRLFDAGFLDVRFDRLSEPNVYSLGGAGRRWARAHGLEVSPVPRGDLSHHLALVSLWSDLAEKLGRGAPVRLISFQPDWELRQSLGATLPVIPDALIELGVEGGSHRHHVALEVDLGTESESIWKDKLAGYAGLLADSLGLLGWDEFALAIVLVGAGPRRHRAISDLVVSSWPAAHWVLQSEKWPESFIDSLPRTALLAASSNSKKGPPSSSPMRADTSALEEEGPSE